MKKKLIRIIVFLCSFGFYCCVGPEETIQSETENADSSGRTASGARDNVRNSLDWTGIYLGTLPCADCEGIETQITLNNDKTYRIKTKNLGKRDSAETSGVFAWNEEGNIVSLNDPNSGTPQQYLVGENTLTKLDKDGNKITGNSADLYVLSKNATLLIGKLWKLTELKGRSVEFDSTAKNEPHIVFKENNKLTGFGGCNNITGSYFLIGQNKITLSEMTAITKMSCQQIDLETQLLDVLQSADGYSLMDEALVLKKGKTESLARFKTAFIKK